MQLPSVVAWYHYINPMYFGYAAATRSEMQARGTVEATEVLSNLETSSVLKSLLALMLFAPVYFCLVVLSLRFIKHQKV